QSCRSVAKVCAFSASGLLPASCTVAASTPSRCRRYGASVSGSSPTAWSRPYTFAPTPDKMSIAYIHCQSLRCSGGPYMREARRQAPWGMDASRRGYDVLLVMTLALDLRNRHLVWEIAGSL